MSMRALSGFVCIAMASACGASSTHTTGAGTGGSSSGGAATGGGGLMATGGTTSSGGMGGALGGAASGGTSSSAGTNAGGGAGTGGVTSTGGSAGAAGTAGAPADGGTSVGGSPSCATVTPVASFASDWKSDAAKGKWRDVQVVNANRMRPDGTLTWHGSPAVRVEVDPGDDPLALGENTERSEALVMQDSSGHPLNETPTSGTEYIATSYLFPTDWDGTELRGDSNSWSIVLQLHGPDNDGVPGPDFNLNAGRRTAGGPQIFGADLIAGDSSSCCGTAYSFSDGGSIHLGKWVDLELEFTFAATATGHLTIWRRDEGQTAFTKVVDAAGIATLQYNSQVNATVGAHYWKQGLYRGGDVSGRTDVLFIGPTARATTFAAAECAAFGTSNGPS